MRTKTRFAALAMLLALAASACVPRLRQPEVQLAGVRLGGIGLEGGLLYVRLSVINPNRFALRADGFSYDIDLSDPDDADGGWVDLAEGTFREDLRVAGNDSTIVEIPVRFTYGGLGGVVRSLMSTGTFDYRVSGRVHVQEPLRTAVPYRKRGTVSLAGAK